jgi:hypothetical protein
LLPHAFIDPDAVSQANVVALAATAAAAADAMDAAEQKRELRLQKKLERRLKKQVLQVSCTFIAVTRLTSCTG